MNAQLKLYIQRLWQSWLRDIVIVLAIMIPFRSVLADWNDVPTGSMKPAILEGDRVFVNKLAYDLKFPLTTWHLAQWDNPKRGDIVVFYSPATEIRLVKRVVGLPGEVLELRNNHLFINGIAAEYSELNKDMQTKFSAPADAEHIVTSEKVDGMDHPVMVTPRLPARRSFGPVKVPENQYLMLGDNRDNSADSRYFGFVERSRIVGKALAVVFSSDRDNFYLPRMDRWLKPL